MKQLQEVYEWEYIDEKSVALYTADDLDIEDQQWYKVTFTNEKYDYVEILFLGRNLAESRREYKKAIKEYLS